MCHLSLLRPRRCTRPYSLALISPHFLRRLHSLKRLSYWLSVLASIFDYALFSFQRLSPCILPRAPHPLGLSLQVCTAGAATLAYASQWVIVSRRLSYCPPCPPVPPRLPLASGSLSLKSIPFAVTCQCRYSLVGRSNFALPSTDSLTSHPTIRIIPSPSSSPCWWSASPS